jgi:ribosomal protein L13, bacterial type
MKSYMAKPETVERKWYVVDAAGMALGRVASQVAAILRGKNKPIYTPNVDCGDFVIVLNCAKIVITGKKLEKEYYYRPTGYIGGLKKFGLDTLMRENPVFVFEHAVKGMLPKSPMRKKMITKLFAYAGNEHNHQAQQPVELKLNAEAAK